MAKNDLKSNARSVLNYLTFIVVSLTKPNSGAPIATMLSIFGNIVKTAPCTNAIMINALLSSKTLINSTHSRKSYVKQNLLNSNSVINTENIILPMNNFNIQLPNNHLLSSTSVTL